MSPSTFLNGTPSPVVASGWRGSFHRNEIESGNMLLVVVIRQEGHKAANAHIADSGCTRVFCGIAIPSPILDSGLTDERNPYVGKVPASCANCISEYNNGRRVGFHEE